ncbi:hypothetical protein [Sphingomonas panaciterrae]|uniref:hypothetical protein n=1 Tax=Sphingomonas panaciterrae TaxID=1462999 RepID=UPI002FF3B654
MSAPASADKSPLISRTRLDMAVHDMLRLFVGRGKRWRVVDLATASGVSDRVIESARMEPGHAEHRPLNREDLLSVMSALGTNGQNVVLELMGTAAHELNPTPLAPAELIALLVDGGAAFAKRGIDGIFCNRDQGELRPFADAMIEALTPFSSKAVRP